MNKLKLAVFMDSLVNRGGIEREIMTLCKYHSVDLYVGRYDVNSTFSFFKDEKINVLINRKVPQRLGTLYSIFLFKKLKLSKNYDGYIFFGAHSLNAAKNYSTSIWYCNSPIRWIYDLHDDFLKEYTGFKKMLFILFSKLIKKIDQNNVKNVKFILVNSYNVSERVRKYYSRSSKVVYPPVDTKKFRWILQSDFYLSISRLDPHKRVNLTVEAFKKMPNKKLLVVGDGPDFDKIKNLSKGFPNINVVGPLEEDDLTKVYGECIATLYFTKSEDFGMIPVESMSSGKPCIATNYGGFKETIIHGETGLLLDDPTDIETIIDAVNKLDKKNALLMRKDCEKRAKLFSEEFFVNGITKELKK